MRSCGNRLQIIDNGGGQIPTLVAMHSARQISAMQISWIFFGEEKAVSFKICYSLTSSIDQSKTAIPSSPHHSSGRKKRYPLSRDRICSISSEDSLILVGASFISSLSSSASS